MPDQRRDRQREAAHRDPAAQNPRTLVQANPTWTLGLIAAACGVGAALLFIGIWAEISIFLDGILSTFFIVSGLALIFGAFGAQATVQYKSYVIAGVAATALIFLFAIDYLRRDSYIIVELLTSKTPPTPATTIKLGDAIIKGTVDSTGSELRTRFFIRYQDVTDASPRFDTEWPRRQNESENSIVTICFSKDKLVHWFGRTGQLSWRLNAVNMEVRDRNRRLIGSKTECGTDEEESGRTARLRPWIISAAHALDAPNIPALIEDLLSDNTDIRRLARDRLTDVGPSAIRPMMDRAAAMTTANHALAFRTQVGAAVAIDNMMSRAKVSPMAVSQQLQQAHFNALIQWTLNRDQSLLGPTLRILANTADLSVLRDLLRAMEHQTDENIIHNTAWILRQTAQRYRNDASTLSSIKQLAGTLRPRSPGEKTTQFLDQIEAM